MLKPVKTVGLFTILLIFSSFCNILQTDLEDAPNKKIFKTIVIDAGHGGKDPGCNQGSDAEEKNVALKVALGVGQKIENEYPNIKVIYTRKKDVFIDLHERSAIANRNKADLFISIHCNANPNKKAFGTETYAMGMHKTDENLQVAKRENAVILKESDHKKYYNGFDPNSPIAYIMLKNHQNAFINTSLDFAQKVQRQFKDYAGRTSRGVHQAGFLVLWETAMPSVLIEIGFLTNEKEEKYLKSEEGQNDISESIAKAFGLFKKEIERN
jgi:N-acetylmuramoyl-L-alanine amidase